LRIGDWIEDCANRQSNPQSTIQSSIDNPILNQQSTVQSAIVSRQSSIGVLDHMVDELGQHASDGQLK
jgi:hypothetical protein